MNAKENSAERGATTNPEGPNDKDLTQFRSGDLKVAGQSQSREDLEKALNLAKKSEALLQQFIDTIPALAWCNLPDGSNEFHNKRWHDYTGLSHQEAQGWGWKVTIHPDDLPKSLDKFGELLAVGQPGEIEARLRRHDGQYRWFLFRAEPLRDEFGNIVRWYGTNTDIESLKQVEDKLRQEQVELQRIVDAVPSTINVMDPKGKVVYANRGVLEYSVLAAIRYDKSIK